MVGQLEDAAVAAAVEGLAEVVWLILEQPDLMLRVPRRIVNLWGRAAGCLACGHSAEQGSNGGRRRGGWGGSGECICR